jgi:hypothetical protein
MNINPYHSVLAYIAGVKDDPRFLNRENIRPEKVTFQATATAAVPPVVTQPGNQRVLEEYWFCIDILTGFFQNPATNPADLAKISFTVSDPAEGRNFFRNAMNLQNLVGVDRGFGSKPMEVPYFLPPGATMQVAFTLDFTSGVWGGAFKTFGVMLEGWLIRRDFAERCGLREQGA